MSSSALCRGKGVGHGVRFESLSLGEYMPRSVEDVRFRTERVRDMKVSEDCSAGVEGVDGVELLVTVKDAGRRGVGRIVFGLFAMKGSSTQ